MRASHCLAIICRPPPPRAAGRDLPFSCCFLPMNAKLSSCVDETVLKRYYLVHGGEVRAFRTRSAPRRNTRKGGSDVASNSWGSPGVSFWRFTLPQLAK